MRAAIGLFTLCRAVAGLSAQDTVPVRGYQRQGSRLHLPDGFEHAFRYDGQTSDLVHQHPFMRMPNPIFGQHGFCTSAYVSRVGGVSAQRCGEHRALRYSGKAAGVAFRNVVLSFPDGGSRRGIIRPPRNVQTQAANNFPLGAQYDSIPGTRSADDHHGIGI